MVLRKSPWNNQRNRQVTMKSIMCNYKSWPLHQTYFPVVMCPKPQLACVCSAIFGSPVVPLVKNTVTGSLLSVSSHWKTFNNTQYLVFTQIENLPRYLNETAGSSPNRRANSKNSIVVYWYPQIVGNKNTYLMLIWSLSVEVLERKPPSPKTHKKCLSQYNLEYYLI